MTKDRVLIVDGNAVIYRAYFATQKNKDESEIAKDFYQTISSIIRILKKCRDSNDYRYFIVVFDTTKNTFRKAKFSDYKSQRSSMPQFLFTNLENIKASIQNLGFTLIHAPELYEGDDVIATLSELFSKNDVVVDIFSTDQDLLQLVSERVTVNLFRSKSRLEEHNLGNFCELNEGLLPWQIPHYKALSGDYSDNYKGVPGIGKKTARNLLIKYGSIERIYENIHEIKESHRNSLINSKNDVALFLELSSLVKNLDISEDLKDYESVSRIRESRK